MNYKTKDHPEACGRIPQPNERQWTLKFPLDTGEDLFVSMGAKGWETLTQFVFDECADTPSYTDEQ